MKRPINIIAILVLCSHAWSFFGSARSVEKAPHTLQKENEIDYTVPVRKWHSSSSPSDVDVVELYRKAGVATSTTCLIEAALAIPDKCRNMGEDERAKIAVSMTNCHLQRSGMRTFPCEPRDSVERCTRNMDQTAFNTYTLFFTQTSWVCENLQNELRNMAMADVLGEVVHHMGDAATAVSAIGAKASDIASAVAAAGEKHSKMFENLHHLTEEGISRVSALGTDVGKVAENLGASIDSVADRQERLSTRQEEIAKQNTERLESLSGAINTAMDGIKQLSETTDKALDKQRSLSENQQKLADDQERLRAAQQDLFAAVGKLSAVQEAVFGGMADVGTVVWYVGIAILSYIASSTPRTSNSRLYLILGIISMLAFERTWKVFSPSPLIYSIRWTFVLFLLITLSISAVKYRNYEQENNRLLEDLLKQLGQRGMV